jgi:PIN domain nuclease of toxin-antitoxin system
VRVLADSHAIIWQSQRSPELSEDAANALLKAEETDGIVVSVASLVDLWYVTQTTKAVSESDLTHLREQITSSPELSLQPIDEDIVDATTSIPRKVLADPWDRFIVATAQTLGLPLITRDTAIRGSELVPTIW